MNTKLFSEAMNEVGDRYYEEAEHYRYQKHRLVKFTSLAACAAIIFTVSVSFLWKQLPGQPKPQPEVDPPMAESPDDSLNATENPDDSLDAAENPNGSSENPKEAARIPINEIDAPKAVTSNIALMVDDYVPMTYEKLLTYFDVSLPITETLPYLTLQSDDFGIYQSEEGDIYFDGNTVVFESSDRTQSMRIVLAKVFQHTYDLFDLNEEELRFADINGRELAIFHYTENDGADCYYTEFLQEDVAFLVDSQNIPVEDYVGFLQSLVHKTQQDAEANKTVAGEITVVDPYANHIGILLDEEKASKYSRVYGIDLPDGQSAEEYSPGDRVEVTYIGEPATIGTIWAEQLVAIQLLP